MSIQKRDRGMNTALYLTASFCFRLKDEKHCFILGKGNAFPIALEGALKLKVLVPPCLPQMTTPRYLSVCPSPSTTAVEMFIIIPVWLWTAVNRDSNPGRDCCTLDYFVTSLSLTSQEIAYLHAEGYNGSALKHGPFALIEEKTPIILILLDDQHSAQMRCGTKNY